MRILVWTVLLGTSGAARAGTCSSDELGPAAAEDRIEWARRCALTEHFPRPEPTQGTCEYDEYAVTGGAVGAYSDFSQAGLVNASQLMMLSGYGIDVVEVIETSGPTAGYCKYVRSLSRRKAVPRYPSYEEPNTGDQLYPHPQLEDCTLYRDRNGTTPTTSSFQMRRSCDAIVELPQGVLVGDQHDVAGGKRLFRFNMPQGVDFAVFTLNKGVGDASLKVKLSSHTTFDCVSHQGGTETCVLTAPAAGTYDVEIEAFTNYSGASLGVSLRRPCGAQVTPGGRAPVPPTCAPDRRVAP